MRIINVDCYYKCDVENGTINCFFVERGVKTGKPYTLQHTFKALNIYDIAKTDFCSCFSSICFINKEVEEKDLIDEKKEDKPLDIAKLEAKIEDLTKTNKELNISYNDLVARANHYIQEKADAQNKLQLADKKTTTLTKDNEDLNERLKTITEKASKYQSAVVLKNDELDYVSSRYQNLKNDVEKLEKKNEELREREKKYCTSHESILKDRNALRKERDKALSDLGVAKTIIKRNDEALIKESYNNVVLQNSLDKFVQSNLDLINQLTVYRSNNKMLIEMVDLNRQVGNDLRKVKQLNYDKMTLTEGINHYKNRVENLENRISELEVELTSKTLLGRSASDIIALLDKNIGLFHDNKDLTKKIKDIGNLLQTLGINIESGDDLVVTIEKVLKDNK